MVRRRREAPSHSSTTDPSTPPTPTSPQSSAAHQPQQRQRSTTTEAPNTALPEAILDTSSEYHFCEYYEGDTPSDSELSLVEAPPAKRQLYGIMAADFSEGRLETTVGSPHKELPGTKEAYVSYLVTTNSDYQSFMKPTFSVRRRFTDFVFLWKQLTKEFPQCAIPPLPDKHKMEYVRGDRFGPDFTQRRAHSLHRFLKRMTLHPVLRRAALLLIFLETPDWNQQMKGRTSRGTSMSGNEASTAGQAGIMESVTDSLLNTFTKVHKPDKRFIEVQERATKLTEDLSNVEKVTMRVARRQADLETDYADLAAQSQKLCMLEPGVEGPLTSFASSVATTSQGFRGLKEHTDLNYLQSLRDMDAYILALKSLLKTRELKQLDFEALTDYLAKSASDRDTLASQHGSSGLGASGFLRSKVEDLRGIDHEQSRRQRLRKLEVEIERLTSEVEQAKKASEAFDEHTVKEVVDFERIKAVEFKDTLGDLADAHIDFFAGTVETWEKFLADMRREEDERKAAGEEDEARGYGQGRGPVHLESQDENAARAED